MGQAAGDALCHLKNGLFSNLFPDCFPAACPDCCVDCLDCPMLASRLSVFWLGVEIPPTFVPSGWKWDPPTGAGPVP